MSSFIKRGSTRRSDDTMDDDTDDKDDTKRKFRNLSEKKRRDQFNMLINELSSMVSTNSRKMDKSTVLKSTISFLKNHNEIAVRSRAHEIQEDWKPSFLSNEEFTHLILEALDGFIMVFSSSGKIFYASESITSLLGHLPSDLLNMTMYDLVYKDDHSELYNVLLNPANTVDAIHYSDTKDNRVSFTCHLKRGGVSFQEEDIFELVQFVGYFRSDVETPEVDNFVSNSNSFSSFSCEADSRLVFVGTGRLHLPLLISEMSVVDSTKSEFTSRHSLEWKFLFLDHRAPPIIGYLPFEVLGTSGYDYYHVDDLEKVVTCHEALMQKGEGTSCHYRFLTKGQQWIWLQTRFYITYHQWNSKPEFIVCTHRVVSYADVMKQLQKAPEDASEPRSQDNSQDNTISGQSPYTKHQRSSKQASQSGLASSPWSSKSSAGKISRLAEVCSPQDGNGAKAQTQHSVHHGAGSDSTSISADSPNSRHSQLTQHSTQSRTSVVAPVLNKPVLTASQSQQVGPPTAQRTFLAPQPQYVAVPVPVQPVLAAAGFPGAIVTSLPPPSELVGQPVVLTSSQSQIQEQLQRKHEELQRLIVQQQEELQRVSEQLLMARYGLLPPVQFNVTLPYTVAAGPAISSITSTLGSTHQHYQIQPGTSVSVPVTTVLSEMSVQEHSSPAVTSVASHPPVQTTSIMIESHQVNFEAHTATEEVIPFQLSQQQAQLLFASPNSTEQHNQW
ncbi:circadian locomoter output cycles protein kaput [Zootermopsis nevadensis]|uniref:circadian locomoter output cycles protein kaput n=1 Tax=Zootermopsis nevadensis TaxID=136037 RepID=UPI000B8E4ADE|nr:circadian locomoter output cycles protein kaput [Zootermopsis nevadensis]